MGERILRQLTHHFYPGISVFPNYGACRDQIQIGFFAILYMVSIKGALSKSGTRGMSGFDHVAFPFPYGLTSVGETICVIIPTLNYQSGTCKL